MAKKKNRAAVQLGKRGSDVQKQKFTTADFAKWGKKGAKVAGRGRPKK
jgi:hypothetical protein